MDEFGEEKDGISEEPEESAVLDTVENPDEAVSHEADPDEAVANVSNSRRRKVFDIEKEMTRGKRRLSGLKFTAAQVLKNIKKIKVNKDSTLYPGIVLGIIAFTVTLLLAIVNAVTAPLIAERIEKETIDAMWGAVPESTDYETVDMIFDKPITKLVRFTNSGVLSGWCATVSPEGYGGDIELVVGMDADLTVTGIAVIAHSETGSIGGKALEASYLESYTGKLFPVSFSSGATDEYQVNAVTGATVTSTAVLIGVNAAVAAALQASESR